MNKPDVVVVYRKSVRKNGKLYLEIFKEVHVDELLSSTKRKPLIPNEYEIIAVGVGSEFEEKFKKKYKI